LFLSAALLDHTEVLIGILVGLNARNIPLRRPRRRWEYDIKTKLQEVLFGGMDWIDPAQDRDSWWALVKVVMYFRVP
jgi:hypothetical protein